MASQSSNLIGQEEEELVAFGIRQSRVFTPQTRPNSRMEEMLSQLDKVQEEAIKSQDAMAKSIVENTRSQEVSARALEAKVAELAKSHLELHTYTDDKLSHIAYKQIEQIAEMSYLVDRISTVERSLQGSPFTGSTTIRLRTFRLRYFVYRHLVYRHFVYYCIPAYRAVIHPNSVSADHYFHQFQLLLTL